MALITLLSDFGLNDWHLPALKGTLQRVIPGVEVIDIGHGFSHEDAQHTALLMRFTWPHFPANTIHFISLDGSPDPQFPYVAIKHGGQYFLCRDDGWPSMMLNGEKPEIIMDISELWSGQARLFAARDLFVKVAALLIAGTPLNALGKPRNELHSKLIIAPTYTQDRIHGAVVYTDRWGNACTNISRELFQHVCAGRSLEIILKRPSNVIRRISSTYADVNDGELLALFNAVNHLEIAIRHGSARQYCGLEPGDRVQIQFYDSPR
jgi:S-adenosylmethionine hydrolase